MIIIKYVVELDKLPNNCFECPMVMDDGDILGDSWCGITNENVDSVCRGNKCPIRKVETE